MIEKVIVVKRTEQCLAANKTPYLKVTVDGDDGKEHSYNIFDQALWNLFGANMAVKVTLEKKGQYWNVTGAQSAGDALPSATVPPPDSTPPKAHTPEPNPQAVGMVIKEIGEMQRAGKLSEIFGVEIAIELVKWYRGEVLAITRIPFDGAKLPQFK